MPNDSKLDTSSNDAVDIPAVANETFILLESRLDAFLEAIRREPPCRWGLIWCRVFFLDGDFVDIETENGIDIPDEVVGEVRGVAAENNAIAVAWAIPHEGGKYITRFVNVELPGFIELESRSRLTKRFFGKFTPWEVRELGVDTWTALPINLPRWAEIERQHHAAPVEPEFVASLRDRDYASEVATAVSTNRKGIKSGAASTRSAPEEIFECADCGTKHTRDATGRLRDRARSRRTAANRMQE